MSSSSTTLGELSDPSTNCSTPSADRRLQAVATSVLQMIGIQMVGKQTLAFSESVYTSSRGYGGLDRVKESMPLVMPEYVREERKHETSRR
jgi:hypothetical protein